MREAPEYAKRALREVPSPDAPDKPIDLPKNVAFEACKHDSKELLGRLQKAYGLDDFDMLNLLRVVAMEQSLSLMEFEAAQVMAGLDSVRAADKAAKAGDGGKGTKSEAK